MVAASNCPNCGAEIPPGAAFCASCGARQERTTADACANCGGTPVAGARFCGECGAPVSGAPDTVPTPALCTQCGAELGSDARFCRQCGTPAGQGPPQRTATTSERAVAPAASRPRSPQAAPIANRLTWTTAVAGAGLIVALLAVLLFDWASVRGFGIQAFDSDARFRISDTLETDEPLDGYVALLVSAAGLVVLGLRLTGRIPSTSKWLVGITGLALIGLGALEIEFLNGLDISDLDFGVGLYLMIAGGIGAAAAPFVPERPLRRG